MPRAARPALSGRSTGRRRLSRPGERVGGHARGPVLAGSAEVLLIRRVSPLSSATIRRLSPFSKSIGKFRCVPTRSATTTGSSRSRARSSASRATTPRSTRLPSAPASARARSTGTSPPATRCSTRSCRAGSCGSTRPSRRRWPTRARRATCCSPGSEEYVAAHQHAQGRPGQDHLGDGRPGLPDPHQVPGAARRARPGHRPRCASEAPCARTSRPSRSSASSAASPPWPTRATSTRPRRPAAARGRRRRSRQGITQRLRGVRPGVEPHAWTPRTRPPSCCAGMAGTAPVPTGTG